MRKPRASRLFWADKQKPLRFPAHQKTPASVALYGNTEKNAHEFILVRKPQKNRRKSCFARYFIPRRM